MTDRSDEREVDLGEDFEILPDQTSDDVDVGWGRTPSRRAARSVMDQRLLDERPPHWE